MKIFRLFGVMLLSVAGLAARAQVVTTQPSPFRDTDQVTLTFDATQGNAGLKDFTGDVYIYTGVVTESATGTTWNHVKSPPFNTGDPASKMTRSAANPNLYTIAFTPRTFYPGVLASEKIYRLAMLFKNADGSKSGRGTGNADIYVDVAQDAFNLRFTNPAGTPPFFFPQNTATSVTATTSAAATITLFLNGVQVAQQAAATSLTAPVTITQAGANVLRATATDGTSTASSEVTVFGRPAVDTAPLPAGAKPDGITYLNGGASAILSLSAPGKQFVYVLGEFNNWQPTAAGFMHQTADNASTAPATVAAGGRWWVQVDGLTPGREYAYQYLVDGQLRIADPYCEKVLDPNNDGYIPAVTYPNLKAYPTGTTGIVSVLQSNPTPYVWQATNFQRPARTNLVIYELLVRDFVARHDYQTLRDTLSYIQRLGANAIELMPVNEFDGNENWGYSPDFYFAPDKYYGTKNDLKALIDECHKRGIAIILDMVLNHSTGNSPMVQLYGSISNGPTADNPWFNVTAPHPYSVYNDFNHESPYTRYFAKNVMKFWLQEYHVDGYRFDLSKGFTQKNSGTDVGLWGQYDQSRVNIWQDYYNTLVATDPTMYPILEHFADNSEEIALSNMGLMLWGNLSSNYQQASMGYSSGSDLSGGYYAARGWSKPNLVTYMDSHDEERPVFKDLTYGNASASYSAKDLPTALKREEMAAALFFTQPGPRMIWQFEELGYDVSIDQNGRTGNKPILWNYYQDANRRHLYDTYRSLIALKKQPVFGAPTAYSQNLGGAVKTISIANADLGVVAFGNFDVVANNATVTFPQTGTWYNYLTGEQLSVTTTSTSLSLQPGQYAVYTSKRLNPTTGAVLAARPPATAAFQLTASPSPTASSATLHYQLPAAAAVSVTVTNLLGATVGTVPAAGRQAAGAHDLTLPVANLANGVYLVRLQADGQQQTTRLLVQH